MSAMSIRTETAKGIAAVVALILIAFLYTKFIMNAEDESYERNREKIERIMDQNRLTNNNELIMGGM